MKQIIQSFKTGDVSIEDVPAPVARPGGLVVNVRASLLSAGTERQITELARKSLIGKARARPDLVKKVVQKVKTDGLAATMQSVKSRLDQPFPLGYSCAGVVMEVGEGVNGFAPGDRVACAGQNYASHAEVNFIPKNLCVRMPEGLDMESGAFVTLGAIALQAVRQADLRLEETVGVIGLGLLGQIVVQLLKASGCRTLGCDPDPVRVELAKELGCDEAVAGDSRAAATAMTGGHGLDCVIVAASTPSNEPIERAGEMCRLKGRVVVLGAVGMNVPRKVYYEKELDLRLSMSYGPGRYDPDYEEYGHDYPFGYVRWTENRNMEAFLRLAAEGRVELQRLVTHRFPVEEALKAYELIDGQREAPYMGILFAYPEKDPDDAAPRRISTGPAIQARKAEEAVIGFVGAGQFAQGTLLPLLAGIKGCRVRGLADVRGEVARHAADKLHCEFCTTDFEELLDDSGINTIVIATRHDTHARFVRQALAAGKHVYVEKPLCMKANELKDIADAYQSQGGRCRLMVGYNRRFAPLILEMKKQFQNRFTPLVMMYRVNAGPVPVDAWIQSSEEGGGRVIGEMCHWIDLFGFMADSPVEHVSASSIRINREDVRPEDNIAVTLKFQEGSLATLVYTSMGDKAFPKEYFEVFGEGAAAALDNFRTLKVIARGQNRLAKNMKQDKGHQPQLRAFIEAVKEGAPDPIPFEQLRATSLATFQILDCLYKGEGT